jgi:phenylalanyl-tRNA synthetase beta chain
MIVDLAGGDVAEGVIDTAPEIPFRAPIVLRASQLERILGIKIDAAEVARILTSLGCQAADTARGDADGQVAYVPPTWRHDLNREADLIEEVARIHGYDKIPEDAPIPVAPSSKRLFDTGMEQVRQLMISAGLSEAMTPSVVTEKLDESLSPWTDRPALETQTPMLKGARRLRRSLLPSLLEGRAKNWASASLAADLFEVAHIYLPSDANDSLPKEQYSLGIVAGSDFFAVKGILESLCRRMGIAAQLEVQSVQRKGFAAGGCTGLMLGDTSLGYLGIVDPKLLKSWKLSEGVTVAELSLPTLLEQSQLVPQQRAVSMYPSIQRDLNFVVAESVRWSEMAKVVRAAVGSELASVTYRETYRDEKKDGKNRKRVLMTVELQRHDSTLSGQQADDLVGKVIGACSDRLSAQLLS